MSIFEQAAKLKLRFDTTQGQLCTEDLFDLSLNSLDVIAKAVNKVLRDETEETFIPSAQSRQRATHNDLRLDILKHVIGVKVEEQDARKDRAEKMARLARLNEIAAVKADEGLASQGLDEILRQKAELEAQLV